MGTHPIFESDFDCLTVKMDRQMRQQQQQQPMSNGQQFINAVEQDLRYVPTREYLHKTVTQVLYEGLAILAKERPADSASACEWLGNFLIQNKNYKNGK